MQYKQLQFIIKLRISLIISAKNETTIKFINTMFAVIWIC